MKMLSKEDKIHNRKVDQERDEKLFGIRAKATIGACILLGFLIALAMFVGFVRGLEFSIRHF